MISNRHGSKGNPIFLNGNDLTIPNIIDVVLNYTKVRLAEDVNKRIFQERELLMDIINNSPPIYGVTRGVGANRNIVVPMEQITDYQTRILLSHCVNVGPYYPENVVRAIMIVRANSLAKGGSGVQPCILNLLIDMLNHKIHPLIPSKGSLGTGDLGSMA
jgi:histidine ammonia-lyase